MTNTYRFSIKKIDKMWEIQRQTISLWDEHTPVTILINYRKKKDAYKGLVYMLYQYKFFNVDTDGILEFPEVCMKDSDIQKYITKYELGSWIIDDHVYYF